MKSRFTTREVAKILALPEWRIRSCVRAGFLAPGRGPRRRIDFSFKDLLLLRTTKGLLDARIPPKRIRCVLDSLKRQLPERQEIWNVTVYADGKRVVVRDGAARWQPDSGQFLFNFAAREIARAVKFPPAKRSRITRRAEQWFDQASELEDSAPEKARRAYEQALALDPSMLEARVNLGRLYYNRSELDKAEEHFRAALAEDPAYALAHFNLGVLLEERGRAAEAIEAYLGALDHDPNLPDAHYNLGLLLEAQGRRTEAFKHLRAARKLYGN